MFYGFLKQQAVKETGLEIVDSDNGSGLTIQFTRTIFNDASDHAFFGYKGFEGVDYAILSPRIDSHELRLNGYSIAPTSDKKQLETCRGVIQRTIEYYRVFGLESQIFLSLQKLILKRNFLGHCELCPD